VMTIAKTTGKCSAQIRPQNRCSCSRLGDTATLSFSPFSDLFSMSVRYYNTFYNTTDAMASSSVPSRRLGLSWNEEITSSTMAFNLCHCTK
jgi:hypothetical protein